MYKTPELIVHVDKDNLKSQLIAMPCMVVISLFLYERSSYLSIIFPNIFISMVKGLIIFTIVLYVIGFINAIFQINNNKPIAILQQDGIWLRYFGFVLWEDIKEFDVFRVKSTPMEVIGIRFKYPNFVAKRASLQGKIAIFWSNITGYPPANLANITIDNNEILNFARQFLK